MIYLKMDDNPGMSLFQNSHFEAIKSNAPAPEEIEAEQDQKRYQKEVLNIFLHNYCQTLYFIRFAHHRYVSLILVGTNS